MPALHVDTDIGGDPDDVAALAMLAGWPDAELVAVTTVVDPDGSRAAMARHCLRLVGRADVPVVAGARATTAGRRLDPVRELWRGVDLTSAVGTDDSADAVSRLAESTRLGATVVAIGPLTNLAHLGDRHRDLLRSARVVVMGGWVHDLEADLPSWGPGRDGNVAADLGAARTVLDLTGDLTLVTLHETLRVHLRRAHLSRLRAAGEIGTLLAGQAEAYARLQGHGELALAHAGLPDDLLVFLHDPLAAAVALGWAGATTETRHLAPVVDDGGLRLVPAAGGRPVRVLTGLDPPSFTDRWLWATQSGGGTRPDDVGPGLGQVVTES